MAGHHPKSARFVAENENENDSDSELIKRIIERDRNALTALYERYYCPLQRFLYRVTGDLDTAQECVNDVMLVVWERASSFGGRSKVSTWIMGIAYRKAMKLRSRQHKWNFRFKAADWHEAVEPTTGTEGLTDQVANRELLSRAIGRLTSKHRAVVELTYYFGYSYEEIAAIVGCPENTVKTRMFHARARLKGILQGLGQQDAGDGIGS
jgi:RNA polymerase sigma-70 factor (ECF subfamily)